MFLKSVVAANGRVMQEVLETESVHIERVHGVSVKVGDHRPMLLITEPGNMGVRQEFAEFPFNSKEYLIFIDPRSSKGTSTWMQELIAEKGFDFLLVTTDKRTFYAEEDSIFLMSDSGKTIDKY